MKRIIALWFILFVTNLLTPPVINYFIFDHVDIRYEAWVHIVVASLCQVVVLAAVLGMLTMRSVLVPFRLMGKPTAVGVFLWFDGLVLLLTLMPGLPESIRLDQAGGLASYYMGAKAVAGGILLVSSSFRGQWNDWDRRWLMMIGVVLCSYGVDYFMPWLAALSQPFIVHWAQLMGWLLFYGPLFLLVLLLLTRLETVWARHSPEAGFTVRYAMAFAVVGATIVSLNAFNRLYLEEPWASAAKACAYLALTSVVAGSIVGGVSMKGIEPRRPLGQAPGENSDAPRLMIDDLETNTGSRGVRK